MTGIVPFKTPEGHDELARRTRRLGQRHRTLLLLVDGRRSADQVLVLARAAGVAEAHYRELLEMGLIALPDGAQTAATLPMPLDGPDEPEPPAAETDARPTATLDVDLPIEQPAAPARELPPPAAVDPEPEPEPPEVAVPSWLPAPVDGPLEQARDVLVRALRSEAPIAGQITLMKVRHASDRIELEALLREVEERLARPRHRSAAARTMRHVRNLLRTPPDTAFTIY